MTSVTLSNLVKDYGSVRALNGLDLSIPQGKLFALLGPSGCGKTTTLRILAGFMSVTAGSVLFGDRDVSTLPPYQRNCGMVFQSYALFPHMTVFQNIAYGLDMRRVGAADLKRRVMEALERVRLVDFANRYPRQLSGGQQQRVALARAIVIQPDVLLLDEPLSNLDAKLRHVVRNEIRQLQQELGLTTIFVTHDQEEALSIGDELVVMNGGVIEQQGTPDELYDKPASRFVADFIGRSNFLDGRLKNGVFVSFNGAQFEFADRSHRASQEDLVLAIKPERLRLEPRQSGTLHNRLNGTIDVVNFVGPFVEYGIQCGGNRVVAHSAYSGRESIAQFSVGDEVTVACPKEACSLV